MSSETEDDAEHESFSELLEVLKVQALQINTISQNVEKGVVDLFYRVKCETTDWMKEPLKPEPSILAWCRKNNVSDTPNIDSFMDACFAIATSIDLETRILTFAKDDAVVLWNGQQRVSIFDIIAHVPTLFK
jgi:hypothetical protein